MMLVSHNYHRGCLFYINEAKKKKKKSYMFLQPAEEICLIIHHHLVQSQWDSLAWVT